MSKFNPTIILIIIILLMGGAIYYFVQKNIKFQQEIATRKQNEAALKDEVVIFKNKNGELVTSKAILEVDRDKLHEYSEELATEVNKLNKDLKDLTTILIKYDNGPQISGNDKVVDYGNNSFGIQWEFIKDYTEDNKRIIQGITKFRYNPISFTIEPINTTLTRDYMSFLLVTGHLENNGIVSTFGSTSMPGVTIGDIRGWQAPQPVKGKNKFGFGLYGGYGLTYSPKSSMIYHGPQVGGGVTFKF